MISTFGGLNTITRGLLTNQTALNTVGHNITNANTEGYSRQRTVLATTNPQTIYGLNGPMQLGTGVDVSAIKRVRDVFVDRQMWKEQATLGYGQSSTDLLGKIENIFGDPSENGLQSVLNAFYSSWQALSTNASNSGARTETRERGAQVVNTLNHMDTQLRNLATDINSVIKIKVDNINQITSEMTSLNNEILHIESISMNANDLRDRRDNLADELSKMINVHVSEDTNGSYTVTAAGICLVSGVTSTALGLNSEQDPDYGYETLTVKIAGSDQCVAFTDGEIKGLIDSRDSAAKGIKAYLNNIDTIAKFFLKDFNDVHKSGYGLDNSTGTNFFGNSGVDYDAFTPTAGGWIRELKVNADLYDPLSGLTKIAAKTSLAQGNGSGDNAILLGNRLKADTVVNNTTLDDFYIASISGLGVQKQDASRLTENQQALVDQIQSLRESISGVNIDEEMTNMIQFQKGYNASARVLTTMDEMLDKLINNTGLVGR